MFALATRRTLTLDRELPQDATLRLRANRRGLVIRALRGTLLVTQEGDAADHVLEAGASLLVRGRGLVVAWALTPAAVHVSPGTAGTSEPAHEEAGTTLCGAALRFVQASRHPET